MAETCNRFLTQALDDGQMTGLPVEHGEERGPGTTDTYF